ncbi:hypothetical protein Rmf_40230 [Roseomonas fluvialis]|uniref:Uncharacterized protein n=1 Tax=Roseomonas fluvialis TaxID=1750527 RepID=A0ABN6P601_9PROT|nr:hypothetical protein Rmf_40230 [Roseomonas fluvialis]
MFQIDNLCLQDRDQVEHLTGAASGTDALRDAALAVERVLAVAHERGFADAIPLLSAVAGLLRDVGSDRR